MSSGKGDAALTHRGFVLLGKFLDVPGDAGGFCGGADIAGGGVFGAEGDIVTDAVAEKKCFLRHESDAASQLRQRILLNGAAVHQNRSRRRIVNAGNKIHQRRFSRTRGPHDRQAGSRWNAQIHVLENMSAVVIEIEIAKFDLSANRPQVGGGAGGDVGNFRLLRKYLVQTDHRCSTALGDVDDPSQSNDRPSQHHHERVEGYKFSHCDATKDHFATAEP